MVQLVARAMRMAYSTTVLLSTGSTPGMPRQTGQTWVLGSAPNLVEQEQKILVRVFNWEWTSRPMTGSNSIFFPRYLRHPHPAVIRAFFPESAVVAAFSGKIGFSRICVM
jgi:hypothetical protein